MAYSCACEACSNTCTTFSTFGGCDSKGDATRHPPCNFVIELVVGVRNCPDTVPCRGYICQHSKLEIAFYLRCVFSPPGSKAKIKHSQVPVHTPQEVCHGGLSVEIGAGWRLFLELYESCADRSFYTAYICHCRF